MKTGVAAVLGFTFVAIVGIIGWLTSLGADTSELIAFIMAGGAAVSAAIPGLLNHSKIQKVEEQTNGKNTTLLNKNQILEALNSDLMKRLGELETTVKNLKEKDNGTQQ